MKTPDTPPQSFVDEAVEQILTGKRPPYDDQCLLWDVASGEKFVISGLPPSGHFRYQVKKDVSRRWIELAYLQKRDAARKYFSAPPDMVVADVADYPDVSLVAPDAPALDNPPEESVTVLQRKIRFLEMQLESHRPYLQLYRLGAGSLFVAVLSLAMWLLTGTGIPFHPVFALGVIPASIGVIAIAFLVRPTGKHTR